MARGNGCQVGCPLEIVGTVQQFTTFVVLRSLYDIMSLKKSPAAHPQEARQIRPHSANISQIQANCKPRSIWFSPGLALDLPSDGSVDKHMDKHMTSKRSIRKGLQHLLWMENLVRIPLMLFLVAWWFSRDHWSICNRTQYKVQSCQQD